MEFNTISNCICKILLRCQFANISVHAPAEDTKDEFYNQSEWLSGACCQRDAIIMLDDFNAKIADRQYCNQS